MLGTSFAVAERVRRRDFIAAGIATGVALALPEPALGCPVAGGCPCSPYRVWDGERWRFVYKPDEFRRGDLIRVNEAKLAYIVTEAGYHPELHRWMRFTSVWGKFVQRTYKGIKGENVEVWIEPGGRRGAYRRLMIMNPEQRAWHKLPGEAKAWELQSGVTAHAWFNVGQPPVKMSPYAVKVLG